MGITITLASEAEVTLLATGSFTYNPTPAANSFLHTLPVGVTHIDTITYRAQDIPVCGPPCVPMVSNNKLGIAQLRIPAPA